MAPADSPQSAAIAELTSSGLSPTSLLLLLCLSTAASAYFYLIPRFWPGSMIDTTLQRAKAAQGRLRDLPFEQSSAERLALWDRVRPESPDNFMGKVNNLRARNNEAWNDGVFDSVKAVWGLYKHAHALVEEMDKIEIQLDEVGL